MKLKIILSILILGYINVVAQDKPYDVFGHNSTVIYETKVSEYLTVKNSDTTSISKSIAFNIEEGLVLFLGEKDTILNSLIIKPEQLLRWLSVDPLAKKYPHYSPYNFVVNNPLNAIDPNGKDVVFLIDKEGAGGKGHMGMLFQDVKGNWYLFSQGAAEQGSTSGFLSNSGYTGGILIQPMIMKNSAGEIIQMTKQQAIEMIKTGGIDGNAYDENITLKTNKKQDDQIYSNAMKLQKAYEKKDEKYRLFTNNCVDAIQDVVKGNKGIDTGIELPSDNWTPIPNSYYDKLKFSVPWMNEGMQLETIPSTMDNYKPKTIAVPKTPFKEGKTN
jgi:hypothetical protein